MSDAADGFPSLLGWGAKSAAAVLATYEHLEAIPNARKALAARLERSANRAKDMHRSSPRSPTQSMASLSGSLARLFVDGAVALCIRAPQRDGTTLDRWYGLFLLFTPLDDERVMRLRLERLLCWRESPERWSSYQHMLSVFILADSPRQAEHRSCHPRSALPPSM